MWSLCPLSHRASAAFGAARLETFTVQERTPPGRHPSQKGNGSKCTRGASPPAARTLQDLSLHPSGGASHPALWGRWAAPPPAHPTRAAPATLPIMLTLQASLAVCVKCHGSVMILNVHPLITSPYGVFSHSQNPSLLPASASSALRQPLVTHELTHANPSAIPWRHPATLALPWRAPPPFRCPSSHCRGRHPAQPLPPSRFRMARALALWPRPRGRA